MLLRYATEGWPKDVPLVLHGGRHYGWRPISEASPQSGEAFVLWAVELCTANRRRYRLVFAATPNNALSVNHPQCAPSVVRLVGLCKAGTITIA